MSLPSVLIAAPTAEVKNYCFRNWIDNVMSFSYPNIDVFLSDNTNDYGANAKKNQTYCDDTYPGARITIKPSMVSSKLTLLEKMAFCHNECATRALNQGYDYLLHLESDIFPPSDVIEQLMAESIIRPNAIIGAMYHTDEGKDRHLMVLKTINRSMFDKKFDKLRPDEEAYFVNGYLRRVFSVGLGCVLIPRHLLPKIKFRADKKSDMAPDGYFAEDCYFRDKIEIYSHTGIMCRHDNRRWGIKGLDYK